MTCPRSDSPLGGVDRTQGLSDPRAYCLSSEATASMHGLPKPGRLSYLAAVHQGPPGQNMYDRWCSSSRGHGHQPSRPAGWRGNSTRGGQQRPGAVRRPAPPSVASGLAGGKGSSTQVSARPAPLVPNTWRGTTVILLGGVGAGGNKTIYLLQLHPVVQGPGPLGDCSQLHSGGGLLTQELGRQAGAWRCQPLDSPPGWASERDLSGK